MIRVEAAPPKCWDILVESEETEPAWTFAELVSVKAWEGLRQLVTVLLRPLWADEGAAGGPGWTNPVSQVEKLR